MSVKKKKTTANGKHQQGVRMDERLRARIRQYQQQMEKTTGLEISFAAAMRSLLEKGLEATG